MEVRNRPHFVQMERIITMTSQIGGEEKRREDMGQEARRMIAIFTYLRFTG